MTSETKNKFISTAIVTIGAFLGFEALSYIIGIYQLKGSLYVAFYVYAFHIFWLTFLFDLHFKKHGVLANARLNHKGAKMLWMAFLERIEHVKKWDYLRHYQNYLVLPGLIYWSTVVLLFLNPFNTVLKESLTVGSTIALAVTYWYMKEHISRNLEHQDHWLRALALVKLYAAFMIFSSVLGVTFYYGFDQTFLVAAILTVTFLLVYQALFQHRLINFLTFLSCVAIAAVLALVSIWVYKNWNTEYFTAGLVMLAVYNTVWGILHHHLEKTLTMKVAFEYICLMILVVTILFGSHNFNQRVI